MSNNLNATIALSAIEGIVNGALAGLSAKVSDIQNISNTEGELIQSEDSSLGAAIKKVGEVYRTSIDQEIERALKALLEDFRAYQEATVANEQAAIEEANSFNMFLDDINSQIAQYIVK